MYDHPIVKAATKLHVEVELPKALQNPVFIAALYLAKRDRGLPADVEKLALTQFISGQGQNAFDRLGFDVVQLGYGEWKIALFKDAPLDEWRIEATDGVMAGIVRSRTNGRPAISRYLIEDELAPDDAAETIVAAAEAACDCF